MKRNIMNIVFLLTYTWYLQNEGQYQVNCNSQNIIYITKLYNYQRTYSA
jgi:hypothetical protein